MAVRLVTDSGSDLDRANVEARGVTVVDLDVRMGDIGPETTRTWAPEEFWARCASSEALPETSAPSPGAFAAAYARARSDGAEGVVCVTLSSKLSATYQAAAAAAASMGGELPVRVVDSMSVTMGEGLGVLAGIEAAEDGAGIEDVEKAVASALAKTRVFGALDTLDNLRKGGRVGGAQALIGSLLSVKPVIEVRDGVVEPESRQRTRSRSLEYLVGKVRQAGEIKRLAVVHAAAPDVDDFVGMLSELYPREEIIVTYIGPVIGTHAGPRSIGVCYQLA